MIPSRPGPLIVHLLFKLTDHARRTPGDSPPAERAVTLTPRERQVLRLVAAGLSNADIARLLRVSVFTARNHVQALLGKSGSRNRAGLVSFAFRRQLL